MKSKNVITTDSKYKTLWLIGLLLLWEIIGRLELFSPLLLPKFSEVMVTLFDAFINGSLMLQTLQSIGLVILGLTLSAVVGVILVYVDYFHRKLGYLIELLAGILHPLPGIALLPIVVLWFGIGLKAVFVVIFHGIVWSFYLNFKLGVATIDKPLIEAAKNNGATAFQLFRFVLLPCSKEAIVTGLMIGWSRGWRSLIGAEMIFGSISAVGGIGWFLYTSRAFGDIKSVYSGILVVALIGVLVEQLVFKKAHQIYPD